MAKGIRIGTAISLRDPMGTVKSIQKPVITILYDAIEDKERAEALARKEKFPQLVCNQLDEILTRRGYKVRQLAAQAPVKKLVRLLEDDTSDLIFNVCESLAGEPQAEQRIASILELLEKRFTGSGSLTLSLAGDKSLSKKLFRFHDIKSPDFAIITPDNVEASAELTRFPLIVKPIATDASMGIDAKSVVHNVQELMERVFYVHNSFHSPALVEEYIDGREIYVGILGNENPEVLPPIEWDLSKLPAGMPRIAGTEAKWEEEKNPEFKAAKEFVPKDVVENEKLMSEIRRMVLDVHKALLIRDYARVDMRLTKDGVPYVIEVNPNPWLDSKAEFAMAARKHKPEYSHPDLIERIVELAMLREFRKSGDEKEVATIGESPAATS